MSSSFEYIHVWTFSFSSFPCFRAWCVTLFIKENVGKLAPSFTLYSPRSFNIPLMVRIGFITRWKHHIIFLFVKFHSRFASQKIFTISPGVSSSLSWWNIVWILSQKLELDQIPLNLTTWIQVIYKHNPNTQCVNFSTQAMN